MQITSQIARQFRELHFGGSPTGVSLRPHVEDLSWEQAVYKIPSFNSLLALVYHINYYVAAVRQVMEGQPLTARDKYSFDHPPVASQADWEAVLAKVWDDAEQLATLIEAFPDSRLNDAFFDEKYGTYFRNFTGILEHSHYHLGQIVILKKMLQGLPDFEQAP